MKNIDLKDLNFKTSGSWPLQLKYAVCVFLVFIILLLAWFLVVKDKRDEMIGLRGEEQALRADFEVKQSRAANLEPLKLQLAQMEIILQQMLRQPFALDLCVSAIARTHVSPLVHRFQRVRGHQIGS